MTSFLFQYSTILVYSSVIDNNQMDQEPITGLLDGCDLFGNNYN